MSRKNICSRRPNARNREETEEYDLPTGDSALENRENCERPCLNGVRLCSSRIWSWVNDKFKKLFYERSDDLAEIIPSIVSFFLGLIVVRTYGESIDRITWSCLHSSGRALQTFYAFLGDLQIDDLEKVMSACLILLFWFGAARVVANIARKIIETPKYYYYNNDY